MTNAPIIYIDADEDDHMLLERVLTDLKVPYPLVIFNNGNDAYDFLRTTTQFPFLIISELSLPGMSGLELREQIEQEPLLRKKSIPFIFMTSPIDQQLVDQAYELTIQGLFEKGTNYARFKHQVQSIVSYWEDCLHPKQFLKK